MAGMTLTLTDATGIGGLQAQFGAFIDTQVAATAADAAAAATSAAAALASQNASATSASGAATSATNASNSATSAAGSASSASTSAGNASTSATNAANSATAASGSASAASTSATNAANSATAAAGSASAAATSASNAAATLANALTKANNLSDVANAVTALANLSGAKRGANSDITSLTGLTTPLTVAQGGSGAGTFTAHGVLLGEGTGAFAAAAVGTTGQMLLGVTGADPAFGNNPTITGGTINGVVIGGTTAAAGSFTALSATGAITPSQTNGIIGTNTNNNANAGSVGEYISSTVASGTVALTNNTPANITSISLTAGDWEVGGNTTYAFPSATPTALTAGINTTSATLPVYTAQYQGTLGAGANQAQVVPTIRLSLSATTTIYLVAQVGFSGGTCSSGGVLWGRRLR